MGKGGHGSGAPSATPAMGTRFPLSCHGPAAAPSDSPNTLRMQAGRGAQVAGFRFQPPGEGFREISVGYCRTGPDLTVESCRLMRAYPRIPTKRARLLLMTAARRGGGFWSQKIQSLRNHGGRGTSGFSPPRWLRL